MEPQNLNDFITKILSNKCPICGKDINLDDFTDLYYLGGFEQTGVCQNCQIKQEQEKIEMPEREERLSNCFSRKFKLDKRSSKPSGYGVYHPNKEIKEHE